MRLLLVDDELLGRDHDTPRLWDGSCILSPVQWQVQIRDCDPEEIDGIILGPAASPGMYQEAIEKCTRNNLPLVFLGTWNENLLRHARCKHPMVVHYPTELARTLNGKQLCEAVANARRGLHRPRAQVIVTHPALRTVVQALLEEEGFKPEVHATLAAARRAAQRHAPDITVADVFLPDGNGLTLLPVKRQRRLAPVILLSPSMETWIREEAHRRGARAVVQTPLDPETLARHLADAKRQAESADKIVA